jgi:hypothetical protein
MFYCLVTIILITIAFPTVEIKFFLWYNNDEIVICITRLETVILQVRAPFVGRGVNLGVTSASTCKTVSSRVILRLTIYLKQNIIIFC